MHIYAFRIHFRRLITPFLSLFLLTYNSVSMDSQKEDNSPSTEQIPIQKDIENLDFLANRLHKQIEENNELKNQLTEMYKNQNDLTKRLTSLEEFTTHLASQPTHYEQTVPNDMVLKFTLGLGFGLACFKVSALSGLGMVNFLPIFLENYLTSCVTLFYIFKVVQMIGTALPVFPPPKH